ncbi:MAG TPA: lysophospholipid acyltransferase family protein [Dehalococcoidia bacterium]|nr:lysophospholipid acyltransferase family protein [Dehalococcoidia bacterium]
MNSLVYGVTRWLARHALVPLYARLTVVGVENVPLQGPLVIASNHLNDADPGIITACMPRPVAFMAKAELFRIPVFSLYLRLFGSFPVNRGRADLSSLRRATDALARGLAVCIFPEGTREGPAAALMEAWPGAGLVALRSNAPVLPIAITGTGEMSIRYLLLHPLRRRRVTVTIGIPFRLPRAERLDAETAREGTRIIMERIAALLPQENRGYYGYVTTGAGHAPGLEE